MINKPTSKLSLALSFKCEGKSIIDPYVIADGFCKYFTNIGPNLASAIPAAISNFCSSLIDTNKSPITLKPTTTIELEVVSKRVASGHAAGYDNIPVRVIKSSF